VYSPAGSSTSSAVVSRRGRPCSGRRSRQKLGRCSNGHRQEVIELASLEERKAICRWGYQELWNTGNLDVIPEAVAEDVVVHDVVNGELRGREEIREVVSAFRTAFPDIHFTIEEQIAEGDTVVTRYTATGTHDGELLDIPPSGKGGTIRGVNISRFDGLQIVEVWETWDALSFVQQLGLPRRWSGVRVGRRPLRR
jgi:steroid delta-isomerase-like uncharacterized protein